MYDEIKLKMVAYIACVLMVAALMQDKLVMLSVEAAVVKNEAFKGKQRSTFDLNMCYDEMQEKIYFEFEDVNPLKVELYMRYGDGEFKRVKGYKMTDRLHMPEVDEYVDAYAVIKDQDGRRKISNIPSFYRESEKYIYNAVHDSDQDGIPDGYEIRDQLGNPLKADTNGNGISDGEEIWEHISPKDQTVNINLSVNYSLYQKNKELFDMTLKHSKISEDKKTIKMRYALKEVDDVEQYINSDGVEVVCIYDNVLGVKKAEITSKNYIIYVYSHLGQIVMKLAYDGENQICNTYEYNHDGTVKSIFHNGIEYEYQYDDQKVSELKINGNIVYQSTQKKDKESIKYANGDKVVISQDTIGNITSVSDGQDVLCEREYDPEQQYQLTECLDYASGINCSYTYDEKNDDFATISQSDGLNITNETDGLDKCVTTELDGVNIQEEYHFEDEKLSYHMGRIRKERSNNQSQIFSDGNMLIQRRLEEMTDSGIIKEKVSRLLSGKVIDEKKEYKYDDNSLLRQIIINGKISENFEYNNVKELVRYDSVVNNGTWIYSYDAGGNIDKVSKYNLSLGVESKDLPQAAEVQSYGYNPLFADQLTSYDGNVISYDDMGNPVKYYNGYEFDWTLANRLAKINFDGENIEYIYNADGLRTCKRINGQETKYYYNENRLIGESTGEKKIWFGIDAYGTPVTLTIDDKTYVYDTDMQDSVIGIYDTEGNKLAGYTYDAWGKVTGVTGNKELAEKNPLRYRGYYYDEESGFYHLQNRYYDPETKRMLNMDTYTDTGFGIYSHNLYAYCENTPVNASNASGNEPVPNDITQHSSTDQDYFWKTAAANKNCYSYAINLDSAADPGNDGTNLTIDAIKYRTVNDLKKRGFLKYAIINAGETGTYKNNGYNVIAFRIGWKGNDTSDKDYHFMKLKNSSYWAHYPGKRVGFLLVHKKHPSYYGTWHPGKSDDHVQRNSYAGSTCYIAYKYSTSVC